MRKLNVRGDTIVEVLIAVAIISLVLAISYTTVRRATDNGRQAQERGVATKLIESQTERLKAVAPAGAVFGGPDTFCLDQGSAKKDFSAGLPATVDTDPLNSSVYPNDCAVDETGNPYGGTGVQYHVAIQRTGTNNFTIYCRWFKAGGYGKEQASLSYRVYQ